jgi:hypothetical protein
VPQPARCETARRGVEMRVTRAKQVLTVPLGGGAASALPDWAAVLGATARLARASLSVAPGVLSGEERVFPTRGVGRVCGREGPSPVSSVRWRPQIGTAEVITGYGPKQTGVGPPL